MEVKRLQLVLLTTIIGTVLMITFHNPIMDLIGLTQNEEVRILSRVAWLAIVIIIGLVMPVGMGKGDSETI